MALSETRGGYGATERPGDAQGSGAGTQRTEHGIFTPEATDGTLESCRGLSRCSHSAGEAEGM